jgi:hypothetical protein
VPDSPSAIQDTKRYLEDFDRVQKSATSDQDLSRSPSPLGTLAGSFLSLAEPVTPGIIYAFAV